MQRHRGELVPAGEGFSRLDELVKALRDTSPQAWYHFTRFDQVGQLVGASEADADTTSMAQTIVLCGEPRTNSVNRKGCVGHGSVISPHPYGTSPTFGP